MSSTQQGKTNVQQVNVKTTTPKEPEKLIGKCVYTACPYEDNAETESFATLKNTDYKFHMDCMDKWQSESRNSGKFFIQDRIAILDEQSGKKKEAQKK